MDWRFRHKITTWNSLITNRCLSSIRFTVERTYSRRTLVFLCKNKRNTSTRIRHECNKCAIRSLTTSIKIIIDNRTSTWNETKTVNRNQSCIPTKNYFLRWTNNWIRSRNQKKFMEYSLESKTRKQSHDPNNTFYGRGWRSMQQNRFSK